MIKLQHKTSLEFITLTPEEYQKLTNLNEYDPVDAVDVVTVFKTSNEDGPAERIFTDKENGKKMQSENPELYKIGHDWGFEELFGDHQSRTLTDDERQRNHNRFDGIIDF